MKDSTITLYPSNWLYNAGVVGLMNVVGEKYYNTRDDGGVDLDSQVFSTHRVGEAEIPQVLIALVDRIVSDTEMQEWLTETNQEKYQPARDQMGDFGYKFIRAGNKLFASKTPYQNLVQPSEWQSHEFSDLISQIPEHERIEGQQKCDICLTRFIAIDQDSKLVTRLGKLQSTHVKGLGPSLGEFPNGFWNMESSIKVCPLCVLVVIHHHLSLTRLSDGSEVFVSAPTFRVMFHLNNVIKRTYSGGASSGDKRDILAMSIIEYALKIDTTLGIWASMNLDIVVRGRKKVGNSGNPTRDFKTTIDFYNLGPTVVQLLSDREIAAILSDLGEFRILNLVLSEDFSRLVQIGHGLLRESLVGAERKPIADEWLFRWTNKRPALQRTAENILRLYAHIDQKQRRTTYGRTRAAAV